MHNFQQLLNFKKFVQYDYYHKGSRGRVFESFPLPSFYVSFKLFLLDPREWGVSMIKVSRLEQSKTMSTRYYINFVNPIQNNLDPLFMCYLKRALLYI